MPIIDQIFRRLGVRISRVRASPYEYLLDVPRYREMTLKLEGHDFRIVDSHSFYHSFREIFYDEIYKFNCPDGRPQILDCGSNCGTSVVYFKKLFPGAVITAVEADPELFKVLSWNIMQGGYSDVRLMNHAVSVDSTPVRFRREGADSGRIDTIDGCGDVVEVQGVRLDDLIAEKVDFLKMDIEGAETAVILASQKLDRVHQLFIEYHSLVKASQALGALLEKLSAAGFRYYIHKQFCSPQPLTVDKVRLGMDMQLNIFAKR